MSTTKEEIVKKISFLMSTVWREFAHHLNKQNQTNAVWEALSFLNCSRFRKSLLVTTQIQTVCRVCVYNAKRVHTKLDILYK